MGEPPGGRNGERLRGTWTGGSLGWAPRFSFRACLPSPTEGQQRRATANQASQPRALHVGQRQVRQRRIRATISSTWASVMTRGSAMIMRSPTARMIKR